MSNSVLYRRYLDALCKLAEREVSEVAAIVQIGLIGMRFGQWYERNKRWNHPW